MSRCILFSGGPLSDCDQIEVKVGPGDFVIACDAGCRTAAQFGVRPDLAVGDFDSLGEPVPGGIPVQKVPAEKDDTDTMLGLRIGLEQGFREFLLVGGFGGRLDHTVANLQALGWLCRQGASGQILSNRNRAWAVRCGTLVLRRLDGWHLSVFAWDGPCRGVTLEGLQYPLRDAELTPSLPIGVSNEFVGEYARITVTDGTLLVIAAEECR